jgi:hypothetical protein
MDQDPAKKIKKSQNSRNQGFSYYFCLMIEGSGFGSVPLTNGSVSGKHTDPTEPDPYPQHWDLESLLVYDPDPVAMQLTKNDIFSFTFFTS